jgi:hypothetical protein
MSSFLADAGNTTNGIVLKNNDEKPQTSLAPAGIQVERRRRPRTSFMARPLGVQFRDDFKLFRVR